jgi:hypothetical protein
MDRTPGNRQRDPAFRGLSLKRLHGLSHDVCRLTNRTRHREHTCFNARDVNEVSDDSPHPRTRSLHAPRMRDDVVLLRNFLPDERRNADHCIQHIQQVVADEAHEVIPHR